LSTVSQPALVDPLRHPRRVDAFDLIVVKDRYVTPLASSQVRAFFIVSQFLMP
jgi:hypothetical protein